jgi:hypothetical protein
VESVAERELGAAAQFLRHKLPHGGNIFCQLEWGGYFNWALQPDGFRVFQDIRMEIIPDDVWEEYLALFHGRSDWQAILDKYNITVLALNVSYADFRDLMKQVEESPNWEEVFRDGDVVVFLKKKPAP